MEEFEVVGRLRDVETIAIGRSIRDLPRLRRMYGRGRWRKRKAFATVRLADGFVLTPSCIGTRQPDSAAANSRSNAS
jgi:hypothetical protein